MIAFAVHELRTPKVAFDPLRAPVRPLTAAEELASSDSAASGGAAEAMKVVCVVSTGVRCI